MEYSILNIYQNKYIALNYYIFNNVIVQKCTGNVDNTR